MSKATRITSLGSRGEPAEAPLVVRKRETKSLLVAGTPLQWRCVDDENYPRNCPPIAYFCCIN